MEICGDMKIARPADWKREPMPERKTTIPLDRTYTQEEMEKIRRGVIPQQMEDKWFIYWDDGILYLHRSWTGCCLYAVHFSSEGDNWKMVEAEVNRDPDQYKNTDDGKDAGLIPYLVDLLLLHRRSVYPGGDDSPLGALEIWSLVGRAMMGDHPENE